MNGGGKFPNLLVKKKESKEELIERMEQRGVKNINKNRTHQELEIDFEQHKKEENAEEKANAQADTDTYMSY
mgnify:FL=1